MGRIRHDVKVKYDNQNKPVDILAADNVAMGVVTAKTDPTSGVVEFVQRGDPSLWGVIGDSRMADIIGSYGNYDVQYRATNWVNWLNVLSGQRVKVISTGAIAGKRTDQYLANFDRVLKSGIGTVVFGMPCVNDIWQNYPAANTSGATAFANIKAKAEQALAAGKRVLCLTEPGSTPLSAAQVTQVAIFNRLLIEWAEKVQGVDVFDVRPIVWSPAAGGTTLTFKLDYQYDGTHYTPKGGHAIGKAAAVFAAAIGLLGPSQPRLASNSIDIFSNNGIDLLDNGLFTALTGGTIDAPISAVTTGNCPATYKLSASDASKVTSIAITATANSDDFGNDLTLAIAVSGATVVKFSNDIPSIGSKVPNGSFIDYAMQIDVANGSVNFDGPQLWLYPGSMNEQFYMESVYRGPSEAYSSTMQHVAALPNTAVQWLVSGVQLPFIGAGSATVTLRRHRTALRLSNHGIVKY